MSIIYSVIAKEEDTILVEYTTSAGNFPIITQNILKKIKKNCKLSYSYNKEFLIFNLATSSITLMKMILHFYV